MRIIYCLSILLLWFEAGFAQVNPDTTVIETGGGRQELSDTIVIPAGEKAEINNQGYSMYGELLDDDPAYNPRYPIWLPASRVLLTAAVNWGFARYVLKEDWARISPATWKKNLQGPWVWDKDRFGINFIGHPHTGNYYFNVARSNGYNYWQSIPFTFGGSLAWELFGENEPPSKNDLINTTLSGAFLGEIFYRVSSNILDDRARGGNRVFREILAGLINPPRGFNRLTQGKMFRVTNKEVYQKEPLNITIEGGAHTVNKGKQFGRGESQVNLSMQFDYGDPFEVRKRKPFDVFRFRMEARFGPNRKLLDNVMGQGILFGKNVVKGKHGILTGIFQHFDYWNHRVFELGTLGFGAGMISRVQFGRETRLFSRLHLAAVPLAGYNTNFGPDTSVFRNYNFGGGLEARAEETFHLFKWVSIGFNGYAYLLNTYDGIPGNSLIGILKPRVLFNLTKLISLGMEHQVYYHNRYARDLPDIKLTRTEQRFFLQVFLEDSRRRGQYH